jgi:hypothetical protein
MNITDKQTRTLRAALIAARAHYCRDVCETGGDGMKEPEPDIKAAMEMLGMQWEGDLMKIFHEGPWSGNEQFKPSE